MAYKDLESAIQRVRNLKSSEPKEILVMEDNEETLKTIRNILENKEVNLSSAATRKEAMKLLKGKDFDCVIVDLNLPNNFGAEMLHKLEFRQEAAPLPVVVYSQKTKKSCWWMMMSVIPMPSPKPFLRRV